MKKITVLLTSLALAACFSLTTLASEAEEIPYPDNESPAEGEIEVPEAEDIKPEESEPVSDAANESETPEKLYSEWIDRITDSTLWINVGTVALSVIGIFAMLKKRFGDIVSLIRGKADGETVTGAIKDSVSEIKTAFMSELQRVEYQLSEYEDNEKKMWAIITIFMTHAKISPSVKVEIMNRLTGIKDMSGSIEEIVECAEAAIAAAESESKAEAPATPALDSILKDAVSENSDFMDLG